MTATWAIQSNRIRNSQSLPFIQALTEQNEPWAEVSINFDGDFNFDHEIDHQNVIPYGSVTLIRKAVQEGWKHVFANDKFRTDVWRDMHSQMLNNSLVLDTLSDLGYFVANRNEDQKIFIRPREDFKAFSGMVQTIKELKDWIHRLETIKTDIDPEKVYVSVSRFKQIDAEWRYFVVDGKIVTGSMYRFQGKQRLQRETDTAVLAEAQALADIWLPHPVCVMDVALSEGEAKVIEFNSFNASGIYDHDVGAIVKAVSDYVRNE